VTSVLGKRGALRDNAGQYRDLETELTDAVAHAIDGGVILAGIACVEDQLVDLPGLDFGGRRRCKQMKSPGPAAARIDSPGFAHVNHVTTRPPIVV
jgi:hypothetical protein